MAMQVNRGYAMPETCEIEENFEMLKKMLIDSRQTVALLQQQKIKLENNLKILTDTNISLKETKDRLLVVNGTQQMMLNQYELSLTKIELLTTELEELKKENFKLKSAFGKKSLPSSCGDNNENHNALLQKKIFELEKQLLQNQTMVKNSINHCADKHAKELSILKIKNSALFFENKSLKEQLTNFRTLHHQILAEIKLKNPKFANDGSKQATHSHNRQDSPMTIDLLDQDEVQPIQVHIIDSDVD